MENNESQLSPQESIQLIQSMIIKAKSAVADNSFYLLFWGWLVFSCCMAQYILKIYLHYPYHYYVWILMPFGGIVSWIYSSRQSKKKTVRTFVEEALDYLWISLAISFIVLIFVQSTFTFYILLYAIGTFVTGSLIRFKPLIIGGLINFLLAAISIRFTSDNQLLIGGLALMVSYIIPGHLLRKRFQQNQK